MQFDDFLRRVEERAACGLNQSGAERAIDATLTTLGELMSKGDLNRLADQLPRELQRPLRAGRDRVEELNGFGVEGFLARVADREGLSPSEALDHARAVFDVLEQAVTGPELHHVREGLPEKFATLFVPPAAANRPEAHRHHPHR
jgi:uncharacterized protein (DUF2267 family)